MYFQDSRGLTEAHASSAPLENSNPPSGRLRVACAVLESTRGALPQPANRHASLVRMAPHHQKGARRIPSACVTLAILVRRAPCHARPAQQGSSRQHRDLQPVRNVLAGSTCHLKLEHPAAIVQTAASIPTRRQITASVLHAHPSPAHQKQAHFKRIVSAI